MEIAWNNVKYSFCLSFLHLCNGYPINSEITAAGQNTQLLTGLVAVLLTLCSLVLLAGCICCQRRNKFKQFHDSAVVASVSSDLDHGHVNPVANGEFTIFTPLSASHYNNNVFLTSDQAIATTIGNQEEVDLRKWFDPSEEDFPRSKLKYIKELGRGWFGKVVEGAAQDLGDNKQSWTPVVVRILESTCTQKEKILFLQDAALYRCGSHPNILSLIGRCLDTVPLLLLQEYCPQGNLKTYLRSNKRNAEKLLSTEYPLIWCCQLTSALDHLHRSKVAHNDLAARNCHLTSNLLLKLGDYGLGPYLFPNDYYQNSLGVPLRWCAPESLIFTETTVQPKPATTEANVWSLGVTMWEICECGEQPYSNLSDEDVISKVFGPSNVRLERPTYSVLYTDYIFRLMQLCWTTNAESRPKVTQIDLMLSDLLQVHRHTASSVSKDTTTRNYVDDFDRRWQSFKPNYIVRTDHISDSVSVEIHDTDNISHNLSNTQHGSLNNLLLANGPPVESYIEDELNQIEPKVLTNRTVTIETSSTDSDNEDKIGLKMHQEESKFDPNIIHNNPLFQRMSSGSETEDENWRNKVERGAYTEKVRMKSRSVADLMVLTHVDYSESDTETPIPSLDYRVNYKNVRLAPNNNFENASITFGSEGNLLSVEDTFQDELRKLKEDRRDSLLFVPDENVHNSSEYSEDINNVTNIPRYVEDLNETTKIEPVNQVYNVFNVTVENFGPIHNKLKEIIFNDDYGQSDVYYNVSESDVKTIIDSQDKSVLMDKTLSNITVKPERSETGREYSDQLRETSSNLVDGIFEEAFDVVEKLRSNENQVTRNDTILLDNSTSSIENNLNPNHDNNKVVDNDKILEKNENAIVTKCESTIMPISHESSIQNSQSNDYINQFCNDTDQSAVEQNCEKIFIIEETSKHLNNPVHKSELSMNKDTSGPTEEVPICQNDSLLPGIHHITDNFIKMEQSTQPYLFLENSFVNENNQNSNTHDNMESLDIDDKHLNESQIVTKCGDPIMDIDEPIIQTSCLPNSHSREINDSHPSNADINQLRNGINQEKSLITIKKNCEEISILEDTSALEDHPVYETEISMNNETFLPKVAAFLCQSNECQSSNKSSGYSSEHELIDQDSKEIVDVKNQGQGDPKNDELKVTVLENSSEKAVEFDKVVSLTHTVDENVEPVMEIEVSVHKTSGENVKSSENQLYLLNNVNLDEITESLNSTESKSDDSLLEDIKPGVVFDTSNNQDKVMPNHLTHSSATFGKKELSIPLIQENDYASINLFSTNNGIEIPEHKELNYSLETWDNFLGKTLDNQSDNVFDSFTSEPHSLLMLENPNENVQNYDDGAAAIVENNFVPDNYGIENLDAVDKEFDHGNDLETNIDDDVLNTTYTIESADAMEQSLEDSAERWESNGGWFLHPQSSSDDPVGEMQIQSASTSDSYVGFGIDDEIMSAIRNELLSKLPHAQGASSERVVDEDEWDTGERNEVFLKYNVYNTPLSPIPEESFVEDSSGTNTPKQEHGNIDSDWSEPCEADDGFPIDTESNSVLTHDSPYKSRSHRHTPSQDSCCSNDTLFNLEELICGATDVDKCYTTAGTTADASRVKSDTLLLDSNIANTPTVDDDENSVTSEQLNLTFIIEPADDDDDNEVVEGDEISEETTLNCELQTEAREVNETSAKNAQELLDDFISIEREYSSIQQEKLKPKEMIEIPQLFPMNQAVPLPSPEDNPWKQLPASLLNYGNVTAQTYNTSTTTQVPDNSLDVVENSVELDASEQASEHSTDNAYTGRNFDDDDTDDYVNKVNMENAKNSLEYEQLDTAKDEDLLSDDDDENAYGVLTDIRFNGPAIDSQLMSTSFSENCSNCNDEQDWDSGSDSRSSSSGEFIWKLEDVKPMESIAENVHEESDISSSFSDEEGETPEFVPSAWDKFATPGKSALRSPEKTLKSDERKSRCVWFKKQKYHCIYEYPREPDSPVLQSQDLWKPQSPTDYQLFADWEFDGETYLPPSSDLNEKLLSINTNPSRNIIAGSPYHLTNIPGFSSGDGELDDDFYISSSSHPFDMPNGLSSQFFPGNSNWIENATPDSGVEDLIMPNNMNDNEYSKRAKSIVPTLKQLSSDVVNKSSNKKSTDTMGGLRHTKNKLKLNLPPSPTSSVFSSDKLFMLESNPLDEPVIIREKPMFTTFGKSRFFVQEVDTPNDNDSKCKNVSFEALPYKPMLQPLQTKVSSTNEKSDTILDLPLERSIIKTDDSTTDVSKLKIEVVRGEASLLDSADEDSGIESSTLERKSNSTKLF